MGPGLAQRLDDHPRPLTPSGGLNLSQYDNADFNSKVDAAKVDGDRQAQAKQWQELNTSAMQDGAILPTRFGKDQRMAGQRPSARTSSTSGPPTAHGRTGHVGEE